MPSIMQTALMMPLPLPTLFASHKGALTNMKRLAEGMSAVLQAHEISARMQAEASVRAAYLTQMDVLCQQQRLLACQLSDAVRAELDAVMPPTMPRRR